MDDDDDEPRPRQTPRTSPPRSQAIHRGSAASSNRGLVPPPGRSGSADADVESILRSWGADTSGVDDDASRTRLGGSFGVPNDAS